MEPWQSWAVVAVGAGAAYYYYNTKNSPKAAQALNSATAERSRARPNRRKEEQRTKSKDQNVSVRKPTSQDQPAAAVVSSKDITSEEQSRRRKPGKPMAKEKSINQLPKQDNKAEDKEGMDDLDFARSLSNAKIGTSLKSNTRSDSPRKTVKQNAAALAPNVSSTSSNSLNDTDNDASSTASPMLSASKEQKSSNGVDVSDMLEAPSSGPSVLKLTESNDPKQEKRPKQKNNAPTQETKKQRQNRRKVEETKLQREEQERERQALLEKQRRTAREARGEPAKNGLGNANSQASNVWKGSENAAPESNRKVDLPATVPLLDTFDRNDSSKIKANGVSDQRGTPASKGADWKNDVPSEEDQMRLIKEQDDSSWSTVGKKAKKKVVRQPNGQASGNESSDALPQDKPIAKPSHLPKPADNSYGSMESTNSFGSFDFRGKSHPNDSDWAVV